MIIEISQNSSGIIGYVVNFICSVLGAVIGAGTAYIFLCKRDNTDKAYKEEIALKIIKTTIQITKKSCSFIKNKIYISNINNKSLNEKEKIAELSLYISNIKIFSNEHIIPNTYYNILSINKIDEILENIILYNERISTANDILQMRKDHIYGKSNDINKSYENIKKAYSNDKEYSDFVLVVLEANKICHKRLQQLIDIIEQLEEQIDSILKENQATNTNWLSSYNPLKCFNEWSEK
jgi:hypothetical protein